jgi:hypothetical protein
MTRHLKKKKKTQKSQVLIEQRIHFPLEEVEKKETAPAQADILPQPSRHRPGQNKPPTPESEHATERCSSYGSTSTLSTVSGAWTEGLARRPPPGSGQPQTPRVAGGCCRSRGPAWPRGAVAGRRIFGFVFFFF